MVNVNSKTQARKHVREAQIKAQEARIERERHNVDDAASFLAEQGRLASSSTGSAPAPTIGELDRASAAPDRQTFQGLRLGDIGNPRSTPASHRPGFRHGRFRATAWRLTRGGQPRRASHDRAAAAADQTLTSRLKGLRSVPRLTRTVVPQYILRGALNLPTSPESARPAMTTTTSRRAETPQAARTECMRDVSSV